MPTWILSPRTFPFLQHLKMYLDFSPLPEELVPFSRWRYWRASPQEQSHTDKSTLWTEPSNDPIQGANSLCAALFSILPRDITVPRKTTQFICLWLAAGGGGVSIPAFTLKWKSSGELDYSTSDLSQVPDGLSCNRHRISQAFLLCPDHVLDRGCVASRPAWFSLEIPGSLCLLGEWQ